MSFGICERQLVDVENGCDLATEVDQRRQHLLLAQGGVGQHA
jgi:hypothetical protein